MEVFERTDKGTPVPDQLPALEGDAGGAVGGMLVGAGVGCQTQRGARATVMRGETTLPAFFLRPTILLDLRRPVCGMTSRPPGLEGRVGPSPLAGPGDRASGRW